MKEIRDGYEQSGCSATFASSFRTRRCVARNDFECVGSLVGVAVAWILMQFMSTSFQDTLSWDVVFNWTFQVFSRLCRWILVTWSTLWTTSLWISRMNVVAAIRSIPTRYRGSLPWWSILVTLFLGFTSLGSFVLAF